MRVLVTLFGKEPDVTSKLLVFGHKKKGGDVLIRLQRHPWKHTGTSLGISIDGCKRSNRLLENSIDGCKLSFNPCFQWKSMGAIRHFSKSMGAIAPIAYSNDAPDTEIADVQPIGWD